MDLNSLTNEDVADILALLDSLPYDELDLETPRFRLTLRRGPSGWTQSTQVRSAPSALAPTPAAPVAPAPSPAPAPWASRPAAAAGSMFHRTGYSRLDGTSSRPGLGSNADGTGVGEAGGDNAAIGAIVVG